LKKAMLEDCSLVMSEVSPAVAAMWRLIEILNSEKKLWQRQLLLRNETERTPRAPPRKKHLFLRSFSVDIPHTICDGNNNFSVRSDDCACFSAGETPCPIHEDIDCDTAMADSAARQDTVPPKNQDITAASPVVEIPASDHQGWLLDQLRGQRVWGSVSDGTLSLYETESTSVPKKAISLHSCRVKPIEFVSKPNQREHNGVVRHYGSNKASKVEKHQFLIENRNNKQNYVFGVASKQELDQWIIALNNASCEDFDSKLSEDTGISLDSSSASFESDSVKLRVGSDTSGMSAAPSPKLRPHSISFSNAPHVKRNSVVEILKRHRSTQGESEQKAQPVRVRHDAEDTGLVRPSRDAVRKSRSFLKNPFDNLFRLRRKKRSSSADDAFERRQQLSSEKTRSNNRLSDSLDSRVDIFQKRERQDSQDSTSSYSPETSPRYVDINYSRRVTSSLKRTASDLKSKLFGNSKDWDFTGVKLNQLQDIKVSGFLLYRQDFKYVKVFCALGHGWLYMFKTDRPEDTALLSIRLNHSCVQYVVELERRRKSLFAFKVSQPQCPSVYLLADDQQSLTKWIMSLQSEASSIQAEQRLADEIRAKKSVQKARVALEIGMSPSDKNVSKQAELRLKRNSCPTFSLTDLNQVQGDSLRRTSDISGIISSDKGTLQKGDKSFLPLETKKLTGLSPDIYDENYASSHFKIAHLISPDSSTVSACVDDINKVSDTSASLGLNSHIDLVAAEAETTHSASWELKHHHKVVADVKSRHVAYSPEVKHESERLLQKAAATVRRAASLNISDVKPATHPRNSVFKPRVTSFFTPVQKRSPGETNTDQLTSRNLLPNVNLIQDATKVATDTSTLSDDQTPSGNIEPRYETKVSRNPSTDKEISNVEVSLSTESDSSFLSDSKKETSSSYSNQPEAAPQYRFDSNVHDSALQESWSTDQSFLLAVISDKLRQRRQRESQDTTSHCFNENVLVVHDDLPLNFTKKVSRVVNRIVYFSALSAELCMFLLCQQNCVCSCSVNRTVYVPALSAELCMFLLCQQNCVCSCSVSRTVYIPALSAEVCFWSVGSYNINCRLALVSTPFYFILSFIIQHPKTLNCAALCA
ncbi:Connector enhancer of kinase suppressor of ras 1, partial [Biomphalaria glabrata]